jgi:hypothetical protein
MISAKSIQVAVALRECLAFHEAFRRLGYPSAHIFVAIHGAEALKGGIVPWCVLRSPLLPRPVNMMCAIEPFSAEEQAEFSELWPRFAIAWNESMTAADRLDIWQSSYVANNSGEFVVKMLQLGHRSDIRPEVLA